MSRLTLNAEEFDRVQEAIKKFPGNAEKAINEVLHGQGAALIEERIRRYMPVSDKKKGAHAVDAKSLTPVGSNLAVTIKSTNKYHYLYFPDDGTNTRRHVGNQRFFERGGESAIGEIVDRCINNLVTKFDEGV